MKFTLMERRAIVVCTVILAFFAGFYLRGMMIRDSIVIETQAVPDSVEEGKSEESGASVLNSDDDVRETELLSDSAYEEVGTENSVSDSLQEEVVAEDTDGRIDLNSATLEELDTLPGIGPVLGQRILDYRTENGEFDSVEEILNVQGIGEKTYEKIIDLVKVEDKP